MTGFTQAGLRRLHDVLARHVVSGDLPGLVALVSRHGETHVETLGTLTAGTGTPMRRDTIFRIASSSKPITAAAAMLLVEDCVLRLDDPLDEWLPELANRRVLRRLDGPLADTEPAKRPITLRDLLTFGFGFGVPFTAGDLPIVHAMAEAGLMPSPTPPQLAPDEYLRRLGELPLMHQPGEGWLYHHGLEVASVLLARAAHTSFASLLEERLLGPLGMRDTGFHVPGEKLDRLATSYDRRPGSDELIVDDEPRTGHWSRPAIFPSGAGGLVSTVDDCHAFFQMLLRKGRAAGGRILSRASVELMTSDQLTPQQMPDGRPLGDELGWGFGGSVVVRRRELGSGVGRYGWTGGSGTSTYMDRAEDLVEILFTQRLLGGPYPQGWLQDFSTATYAAFAD
ncbi:MAG: serine hydrolase domain-containing protein [Candidatus Dormiibacterota bacterium]